MNRFTLLILVAFFVCYSGQSLALSISMADTYFPSYGAATHDDQYNEWLGAAGDVYDGVTWSTFVPGQPAWISFTAHVGEFWLDGDYEYVSIWVDWDVSRTFDTDEEVVDLDDYWFDYGDTEVTTNFTVPSDALIGTTWMRARLTYDGDLVPSGNVLTGEVEDYEVSVIPEPGSLILLGFGLIGLVGYGRRKWRSKES